MPIPTTPIDTFGFVPGQNISSETFSAADVLAAETLLGGEVGARRPELDVSPNSSLYDTVVRPDAVAYLLMRRMLEAFRQTMSLQGIEANPSLASGAVVDSILSNYLMTRNSGTFSTGWLMVSVSSNKTSVIQAGTTFTSAEGYTYLTTTRVAAVDGTPSAGQSQLYVTADGSRWYYYVQVTSSIQGSVYNSPTSSGFTCSTTIPDLVYISIGRPFGGGSDGDSVSSLSDSVIRSLSVRNLVSRASVASELPKLVTGVLQAHAVGSGHPLMLRGRSNVFGIPIPGHVDVYISSSMEPSYNRTVVTAIPVGDGTWTAEIGGDGSVGVMDITAVRPAGVSVYGTYQINSRTRSLVTYSQDAFGNLVSSNHVTAPEDCAGSVYQRCSVNFSLETSDLATLGITPTSNLSVEVETLSTNLIPETHLLLTDGNVAPVGYDMLARPFVPCIVSFGTVSVSCDNPSDPTIPSLVSAAMATYVNGTLPGSSLLLDGIVSIIRGVPGVRSVSLPIRTTGTIVLPDASFTRHIISSLGNLVIDDNPSLGIGHDNVTFMIQAEDINISTTRWTT